MRFHRSGRIFFAVMRKQIYAAAISPLVYVCALLLEAFCAVQFFFGRQFFSGSGTTDLHYFFSAVPYACTLLVPALCLKEEGGATLVPLGAFSQAAARLICSHLQFCAILVPLAVLPICVGFFGDVDRGQVLAGFFMLAMYGAASCALCEFFNALFSSRPVAFVMSASALAFANTAHILADAAGFQSILSSALRAASFFRHFDSAGRGILDSRDIVFYAAASASFLALSAMVLERRAGRSLFGSRTSCALFAAMILLALLDSTRIYFRADMTGGRRLSLSRYSRERAASADSPVRITYYRSKILSSLYPGVRDIPDFLEEYSYCGPVSVREEDADALAAGILSDYGIYGRQIQRAGDNRMEFVSVYSAVVIEYKDAWEAVPFVLSSDGLEYAVAVRLERLLSGRMPSAQILVGNGMTLSEDYGYVRPWLEAQGFSCTEIRLDRPIPAQIERGRTLCVFGSSEITSAMASEIEQFLSSGGRAFFAMSPYSADISDSWRIAENSEDALLAMLGSYGLGFSRNIVGDISCARITMESGRTADGAAAEPHARQLNYPLWVSVLPQRNAPHGMTLFWPSALQIESADISPLLFSSPSAYQAAPDFDSGQSLFETNPFMLEAQGYADGAVERGPTVLAAALDGAVRGMYVPGEFDAEAVLVSDQYFANSLMLGYIGGQYGDYRNLDFLAGALLRLGGFDALSELHEKSLSQGGTLLYKARDYESFSSARRRTLLLEFAAVPALIAASAACMLALRKRRVAALSEEIRGKKK